MYLFTDQKVNPSSTNSFAEVETLLTSVLELGVFS